MTLVQAVAVLNKYRFLGCDRWKAANHFAVGCQFFEFLPSFAAIAIAEAYQAGRRPQPAQPIIEGVTLLPAYQHPDVRVLPEHPNVLTYSVQVTIDPAVATYTLTYTTTPAGSTTTGPATSVPLASGLSCNPLDAVSLTVVGVGTDGVSSIPSLPFTFTAASGPLVPPPTAPAQPVVTGVTQTS